MFFSIHLYGRNKGNTINFTKRGNMGGYNVLCPLVMAVLPVLALSFMPYGFNSSVNALIFSVSPVTSTVIVFVVTSTICPLNMLA